jgi:tetratricopeptide (TPR) repeat protein
MLRSQLPPAATDPARRQALMEEGLRLAREWRECAPDSPEARVGEIRRLDTLATFLVQQKRDGEAEVLLQEALAKTRELPPNALVLPSPREMLAEVLQTLGILEMNQKDPHCEELLGECLRLREELAREFPTNLDMRCDLGAAVHNLGLLYYRTQRDELALAHYERARDLQRSVLAQNPTLVDAQDYLMQTLISNGTCLTQVARREALVANSAELGQMKERPSALRTAARHYLRAIELLAKETVADADALRAAYAEQAMALLLEAEAAGWGSGSRFEEAVYEPLEKDPRFSALKERIANKLAKKGDGAGPATAAQTQAR